MHSSTGGCPTLGRPLPNPRLSPPSSHQTSSPQGSVDPIHVPSPVTALTNDLLLSNEIATSVSHEHEAGKEPRHPSEESHQTAETTGGEVARPSPWAFEDLVGQAFGKECVWDGRF